MGFTDEYLELRKKRKKEEKGASGKPAASSFNEEYSKLREKRLKDNKGTEDIAPLLSTKKTGDIAPVFTARQKEDDRPEWIQRMEEFAISAAPYAEEEKRTWLQKGAFADGYQFGDISKTILGTVRDVEQDLISGAVGIVEPVIDAGGYLLGGAGKLIGAEVFADDMEQFIAKDLIDEEAVGHAVVSMFPSAALSAALNGDVKEVALGEGLDVLNNGETTEKNSVLGDKSDALVQSGGQLAATIGLQQIGVPWQVTTGVTGFGGGVEQAFNEGASYGEAGLSGLISAGADILTESLFRGSGLGEKGLINLAPLTKGISNKVIKTLADYGLTVASEGFEEIAASVLQRLGTALYKEENVWGILTSEEAIDEYIESFIGGSVLGGVMNAGKAKNSIQTGRDFNTELTANEQAVVDLVYNERVAEVEKEGKVSKKEKAKIYDEVINEMEKGYISTDTIESVLGGETYKSYRDTIDSEEYLKQELNELRQMKSGEMNDIQKDRLAELKAMNLDDTTKRDGLRAQLDSEMQGIVKDSYLAESYNERSRRRQAFTADVTQYDARQRETVQRAIDSGVLNNTRRSHELVDMLSKLEADKGMAFDFTNNAKLKDSSFALDGKTVNGYVTKDGITLNVDSAKSLNSVVGHEITHVLEGTELYTALQNAITEYARQKGDYQGRYDTVAKLYENVKDADIDAELTADLVGDYLFTDTDFINNLSVRHRNVFQKIYDEIKYLLKVATAGSKEARELEKVKRAFDKAYKESGKASDETKYSISETTDGRFVAVVDSDILRNIDTTSWDKTKKDAAKKAAKDALTQFSDGIVVDGITRKVNRTSRREYTRSKDTERLYKRSPDVFADKMRAADVADDIVVAATNWSRDGGLKHPRTDNFVDFDHGQTLIVSGDAMYSAEVVVGITDTGEAVFYDVVDMTPTTFDIKKSEPSTTATTQDAIGDIHEGSSGHSIAPVSPKVKRSISDEGEQIAPVGNYNVYGKDVALEAAPVEDIAPVQVGPYYLNLTNYDWVNNSGQEIAPVQETAGGQQAMFKEPKKEVRQPPEKKARPEQQRVAQSLTERPKAPKEPSGAWAMFKDKFVDKGTVFETMSLKTGNKELEGKWKAIGRAESSAQWFMEHGNGQVKSLDAIREEVGSQTQPFFNYLHHRHNIDRMSLDTAENQAMRAELRKSLQGMSDEQIESLAMQRITKDTSPKQSARIQAAQAYVDASRAKNKPVFGDTVTADDSRKAVKQYEKKYPEFREYAQDVYNYMNHLRKLMAENGIISKETVKLWAEMYPHYVPISRVGKDGNAISVPLDSNRTGIDAPIKRATGGNSDMEPLFDTMATRTEQTFKAVAKNRFGVELKNALGTTVESKATTLDEAIDSVDTQEGLLQEGKNGRAPTFTVFENGKRVTFEITEEMYDTMKPKSKGMMYTNKILNKANNIRRGLLTEYNPAFMLTNPIKDLQDVLVNSQHPVKTYKSVPKAISELWNRNGQYYREYMEHGGEQNTYFDGEEKTFVKKKSGLSKVIGFPLEKISQANNFIERIPRMAEYIASRKMGRSIDVSMLDAARVTTDFSAGGDFVKLLNRNGVTFLNASVQGAVQQVRNIREAKHAGLKGWAKLAGKVFAAGLPAMLLNHLLWDDDEDYAELSDYVKQNYYIVAKYGDGKFVRIPKGRTLAVIQDAFKQMDNLATGNDEVDLEAFGELVVSNLAPNSPLDNNLIAPIRQAAKNETWYGEDLIPSRLENLPAAEQYDESTDAISKWLGEKLEGVPVLGDIGPYKWNYLIDQYSGGVGDVVLPMLTPEAESGDNSLLGNLLAPVKDKFTTDSVMKNQNVSDFYDTKDKLAVNANASNATDEDKLKYKYMNSVNAELADLYAQKREIQNSDLPDDEKYAQVRDIQQQIVELTRESLNTYEDISIDEYYSHDTSLGEYASVGDIYFKRNEEGEWSKLNKSQTAKFLATRDAGDSYYATDGENHYRWYVPGEDAEAKEPGWEKITDKQLEKQKEVTNGLGITPEDYWGNKDEYDYAYEHPENYAVAKAVGGYDAYKGYSSELYDIKADKDENGKSISGSRKEKVIEYINNLDADYGEKIILYKSEYTSDDTYNYEIIDYLNSREDISYAEMEVILKQLGFVVSADGTITW